ncbi:unnamed protein product [Owenia fusiformis]|uniref:Uncharacterized protein n=1 Tax=Owenia fusiformis TaxID=6347 RepID=A0A8J1XKG3_OWEFU|nr:unnamed protein product [Owenia fusiformis]
MSTFDSKFSYKDYIERRDVHGNEYEGISIRHLQDNVGHHKAQVDIFNPYATSTTQNSTKATSRSEFTTLEHNDIYVPASVNSADTGVYSISTQTEQKPIFKRDIVTPIPIVYRKDEREKKGTGLWWKLCLLLVALLIVVAAIIVIVIAVERPCKDSPCKNGGNCVNYFTTYTCECKFPYTGATCTDFVDGVSTYSPTTTSTTTTTERQNTTTAPCTFEVFQLSGFPNGKNTGLMTEEECKLSCLNNRECAAIDYYNGRCWVHAENLGRSFANFTTRFEKVNCV